MALVLAKVNAIREWRTLAGPTNSNKAREEAPESVRALYGTDGQRNAVHGSDSPASAEREIRFFFPNCECHRETKPLILNYVQGVAEIRPGTSEAAIDGFCGLVSK